MPRSNSIPDRWTQYKPVGEKIQGTRFIAFKVPLTCNINKAVQEEARLDNEMLLKAIPNLGLIIDLTNTTRYYDPEYFTNKGVEYRKLKIPGHVTPPDHIVKIFKRLVKEYLSDNQHNTKLIGVHCTHGVNRTGFLICHYMISEMTMNPDDAIKDFSEARGHSIERQNYLKALQEIGNVQKRSITYEPDHDSPPKRRSVSGSIEQITSFEQRWNSNSRPRKAPPQQRMHDFVARRRSPPRDPPRSNTSFNSRREVYGESYDFVARSRSPPRDPPRSNTSSNSRREVYGESRDFVARSRSPPRDPPRSNTSSNSRREVYGERNSIYRNSHRNYNPPNTERNRYVENWRNHTFNDQRYQPETETQNWRIPTDYRHFQQDTYEPVSQNGRRKYTWTRTDDQVNGSLIAQTDPVQFHYS